MSHTLEWKTRLHIFEEDGTTKAHATLDTGTTTLTGHGAAHRNPADPDVPEIGDELARAAPCATWANSSSTSRSATSRAWAREAAREPARFWAGPCSRAPPEPTPGPRPGAENQDDLAEKQRHQHLRQEPPAAGRRGRPRSRQGPGHGAAVRTRSAPTDTANSNRVRAGGRRDDRGDRGRGCCGAAGAGYGSQAHGGSLSAATRTTAEQPPWRGPWVKPGDALLERSCEGQILSCGRFAAEIVPRSPDAVSRALRAQGRYCPCGVPTGTQSPRDSSAAPTARTTARPPPGRHHRFDGSPAQP